MSQNPEDEISDQKANIVQLDFYKKYGDKLKRKIEKNYYLLMASTICFAITLAAELYIKPLNNFLLDFVFLTSLVALGYGINQGDKYHQEAESYKNLTFLE